MDFIKGFGLISAALLVLLIFFLNYRSTWEATTREPFTNILRRNKLRFSFIIPVGLAAAGGLVLRWTQSVGQNRGHVKSGSCCLKRLQ